MIIYDKKYCNLCVCNSQHAQGHGQGHFQKNFINGNVQNKRTKDLSSAPTNYKVSVI